MARDDICRSEGPSWTPSVSGTHVARPNSSTRSQAAVSSSAGMTRATRINRSDATPRVMRQASIRSSAAASRCGRYSASTPSRHRHVAPDARGTHRLEKTRRGTNLQDGRNPRRRACPRQSDPGPSNPVRSSRQCYGRTHGRRAHSLPPHRVITGRTQTLTRHIHAGGLKILIRLERLVAARHAIKGRPLLERKRVDRHMMWSRCEHAIERALPTRCGLPGKSAHKVARHVKPSVLDRRDGSERPIGIVNTADGSKFGVIERLHAQRDACDTNLGKRSGKLGGQRLGIGLAGKLNGGAPRRDTPGEFYQALPRQRRRTAPT